MKYIQFLWNERRIVFIIMLMENSTMFAIYHDYFSYIFSENPSIEEILLPYGNKMNKYEFLSRVYPLFAFKPENNELDFQVFSYINTILNTIVNKEQLDNDLAKLFKQITSEINELRLGAIMDSDYNLLTDALLKFSILCENINMNYGSQIISYKTSSFKIDNVLNTIENKLNFKGIMSDKNNIFLKGVFYKLKTLYNENILNKADENATTRMIVKLSKTLKSFELEKKLQKYYSIISCEILLIIANTYNEHIKEQHHNEW